MSLYFFANNIHFTIELIGALVFFVMSWLAIDGYKTGNHYSAIFRVLGFALVGIWQVIFAFSVGNDVANFFGFITYIIGLLLIIISFLSTPKIAALSAVIIIPTFQAIMPSFEIIAGLLLIFIGYLAYQQMRQEYNKSLVSFWAGFFSLAVGSLLMFNTGAMNTDNIIWYINHALSVLGFLLLAYWVWQYLRMRAHESLVLIFIAMTLFISTIVTLAFSTILISKIEQQTRNSLLIDSKVFDFTVHNLMDKSSAESKYISANSSVAQALLKNDTIQLQTILTQYLDSEKLGFILVTDKSGTVIMRAHSITENGDSIAHERAVEEALVGNPYTTIESSPSEGFSIRSSSPIIKDNKVIGTVVAGFPLDNVMVDGIKKITGLDTTIYQNDKSVATTSLAGNGRSRLVGNILKDLDVVKNVLKKGDIATTRVVIEGIPFLASYIPIVDTDQKIVGMFSSAKPQADIIELANSTNKLTLATVTILLLLLSIPLYAIVRRLILQ